MKLQQVAYDKKSNTYEVFDAYGGAYLEPGEILKLARCVKKNDKKLFEEMKNV